MKPLLLTFLAATLVTGTNAQYYYKDLLVPRLAGEQLHTYKGRKIHTVKLSSFESDGEPTEDFRGEQEVDQNYTRITTTLQSALSGSSQLISYFNASGALIKTTDTADGSRSTTEYQYRGNGELSTVKNISISAGGHPEKEEHLWSFSDGKPAGMVRIKDNSDSTAVTFVLDEKGNIAEEHSKRNGNTLPAYYYYYDSQNRLTDIASYNIKARRLLPDYVFEYASDGALQTMMVVPEGSSDYQKWYYEYRNGLKAKETVFNKKKQLIGKIEYSYD